MITADPGIGRVAGPVTSVATRSGRSTVYAPNGAVATSQPLATGEALRVLQSGGNAIDAAIVAAAVLNVTEPQMTGIGGDMFAVMWSERERRLVGIDACGRSGSRVDVDTLLAAGAGVPQQGAPSVTVPGALAGWAALLERYGSISLAEALAPAIRIASEGFPVTPIIARGWGRLADSLRGDEGAAATFLVDGRAPHAGEWVTNAELSRTFECIATDGPGALYGGVLGRTLIERLDELGGYLTLEDLESHEVRWVEPLSVDFRGYTLHELPPSGQGIAALQMLKMLERIDLTSMEHSSAEYLHTLIEAKKLAFADLARYVGDVEHLDVAPGHLLDSDYLSTRAELIDEAAAADLPAPGAPVTTSETIYLTTADRDGNMVSFINSIFEGFGAGVVVPGTGFALQNRGAGFVLDKGHPNCIGPRKRPFHTIIPAFVTKDGAPWMSFGVMGGSMQPQGHVQVLLNMLVFGMDPQEAIDAPRFRHESGRPVAIENLDPSVADRLVALGHELVEPTDTSFGGGQAIVRLERGWAAASDSRKDGMAAGH